MKIYVWNLKKAKQWIYFLSVFVCLSLTFVLFFNIAKSNNESVFEPTEKVPPTIIIDAGHGGEDPGAIGQGNIYEKDLNLQIALCMGGILKEKGFNVVYTREEDKMLYSESENIKGMRKLSDLKNRAKIANNYPNAILISVHMNAFGDSKYKGLQVYYQNNKEESYALANTIQNKVKNTVQTDNTRNVKNGKNIYLLDNAKPTSVLIECGFMSNKEELEKLSSKEYQKELSFSVVCAIIEYMK